METRLTRFFNRKPYVHFIFWWILSFSCFFILFYFFDENKMTMLRLTLGSSIVGVIMAGGFTALTYLMQQGGKFFEGLSVIEEKAKNAKTANELIAVRNELIAYWKEKSFHRNTGMASREVLTLIDTRLVFEFKQKLVKK